MKLKHQHRGRLYHIVAAVHSRIQIFLVGITLLTLSACSGSSVSNSEKIASTTMPSQHVYLVRHAEKKSGPDPVLSEFGQARAQKLADILADLAIEHIYSTDTNRTRQTAHPLAIRNQVEIKLYDPQDLPSLAQLVRNTGANYLIVGHSNTTAQAVLALGGQDTQLPIREDEYDRLYHITIPPQDSINSEDIKTELIRFDPEP